MPSSRNPIEAVQPGPGRVPAGTVSASSLTFSTEGEPETTAEALGTTGVDVAVGTAVPPNVGQVLTATGSASANWQDQVAEFLGTTGANVAVGTAGPPTVGAVLTAQSPTTAAWVAPAGTLPPSGVAGGDLSGNFPAPVVERTKALRTATAGTDVNVSLAAAPVTAGKALITNTGTSATWQLPGGDLSGTWTAPTVTRTSALKTTTTDVNVATATAPTGAGQALITSGTGTTATWQSPTTDLGGTWSAPQVTRARGLMTNSGTVSVSGANPPVGSGQVLTATNPTTAIWQSPASSLPPNGPASGHLSGNYPNPTVVALLESGGNSLDIGAIPGKGVLRRNNGGNTIVGTPLLVDDSGAITGATTLNTRTIANWVEGPTSAVTDNIVQFANSPSFPGRLVKDSGINMQPQVPQALDSTKPAAAGNSPSLARADHVHEVPFNVVKRLDNTADTTASGVSWSAPSDLRTSLPRSGWYEFDAHLMYSVDDPATGIRIDMDHSGTLGGDWDYSHYMVDLMSSSTAHGGVQEMSNFNDSPNGLNPAPTSVSRALIRGTFLQNSANTELQVVFQLINYMGTTKKAHLLWGSSVRVTWIHA